MSLREARALTGDEAIYSKSNVKIASPSASLGLAMTEKIF
jgi:hypothetical protein